MKPGRIRPLVLGVLLHEQRILVTEYEDHVKGERFYRPPGGGIRFGERSEDALRREIQEELGSPISNVHYLGAIENIFSYNGQPGHEIVLLYQADLDDPALYQTDVLQAAEGDKPLKMLWKPLADFVTGRAHLYPSGLLELLKNTYLRYPENQT